MTDLQASLIGIGSVIVIGVVSYNKWQEWRARKSVDRAFSPLEEDVLMGAADRLEPVMTSLDENGNPVQEPSKLEATVDAAEAIESSIKVVSKPSPLDAVIDCIIPLTLDNPLRGEKISAAFQHLRLVGNKPVQIIGQSANGNWEAVAHGGVYHALQAGVQLATRTGPLTELEYSELVTGLNQLSDDIGAQPELPDMQLVMAEARQLHHLVQEFDAQLSINVKAKNTPWMLSTLRPALQRQGMELRPDGRLIMPDGEGGLLFSLLTNVNQADDTSKLMTLLLPVPSVAPHRQGFAAMTAFAKSLANRLTGSVVDDSGELLSDEQLEEITAQVQSFYAAMEQAGIAPGSVQAQRLFG